MVFSLIDLRALFSAWRIFLSSSSFSAISLDSYTLTVAQAPADVSAILICLFLSLCLLIIFKARLALVVLGVANCL